MRKRSLKPAAIFLRWEFVVVIQTQTDLKEASARLLNHLFTLSFIVSAPPSSADLCPQLNTHVEPLIKHHQCEKCEHTSRRHMCGWAQKTVEPGSV